MLHIPIDGIFDSTFWVKEYISVFGVTKSTKDNSTLEFLMMKCNRDIMSCNRRSCAV